MTTRKQWPSWKLRAILYIVKASIPIIRLDTIARLNKHIHGTMGIIHSPEALLKGLSPPPSMDGISTIVFLELSNDIAYHSLQGNLSNEAILICLPGMPKYEGTGLKVNVPANTSSAHSTDAFTDWIIPIAIGFLVGYVTLALAGSFKILAVALGLIVTMLAIFKVEWGLLIFVFLTYIHFSEIAIEQYGFPSVAKPIIAVLSVGIIFRWAIRRIGPFGWRELTLWLSLYGIVGLVSMLYAPDTIATMAAMTAYTKNCMIAILVVIILNQKELIRYVTWSMLAAGLFIASIGVYQHLTGSYDHTFGGFGKAIISEIVGEEHDYRIAGPIGGPNYFAMILVVFIPLAFERIISERNLLLRVGAFSTLFMCLLAIVFTYSRGAFIALLVMLVTAMFLYPPRFKAFIYGSAVLAFIILLLPSQYYERITTLKDILPYVGEKPTDEDSFRGRMSEIAVATKMIADHPFRGVGFGNYETLYQKYAGDVFLDFRRENREAHNLYLEILAETGLLGLTVFGLLFGRLFYLLFRARRKSILKGNTELARQIAAIGLSLIGFLTASFFLHDAYPRFLWVIVGIAFATPNIVDNEEQYPLSVSAS